MGGGARLLRYALRPRLKRSGRGQRARRFLLVACYDPWCPGSQREGAELIVRYSRHRFDLLNLCGLLPWGPVRIPGCVRLRDYEGVLLHSSLPYPPEMLRNLDQGRREKLADFPGLKIVAKQDEQADVHGLVDFLRETGVQLLLTCVSPQDAATVYPPSRLPGLQLVHVRAGYVMPSMRAGGPSQDDPRPIDIGYRGSAAPAAFGRLCYEKRQIGEVFAQICAERNWKADISSRPEDRIYGPHWLRFLGRAKATLGVESGGSVFDFTGEIHRQCEAYQQRHPAADFETVHQLFLAPHEGRIHYRQVAPRHFEAAACRTLQILYEGEYSGIFQPFRHYLPLKRDLGNLDEVAARFLDPAERRRITERAYGEIIRSDACAYESFVKQLDDAIDALS
jgi:hypothetical protein